MAGENKKKLKQNDDCLIFVDTNIFLDFYRSQNEVHLHLLEKLKRIKKQLIMTFQIEMEFNKNRQAVLHKAVSEMKWDGVRLNIPAFLNDSGTKKSIEKLSKAVQKKHQRLRDRIARHLSRPLTDPVYKAFKQLQDSPTLKLTIDSSEAKKIWRYAWRRYVSGCPPRKDDTVAIGDALNWEWILCCAKAEDKDVIIVTRDTDYGLPEKELVNDWLQYEFRKRAGRGRCISITKYLSDALENLSVPVTKEERASENALSAGSALLSQFPQNMESMNLERLSGDPKFIGSFLDNSLLLESIKNSTSSYNSFLEKIVHNPLVDSYKNLVSDYNAVASQYRPIIDAYSACVNHIKPKETQHAPKSEKDPLKGKGPEGPQKQAD